MAKTWQIILATVAIFLAGLVTGGATVLGVVNWFRVHRAPNAPLNPFGPHPGQVQQLNPQLIRNFALQLNLTQEQRAKIGPIMRRAARLMTEEISDVLTPEQRTRFEELIREQKERIQEYRQAHIQAQAQGGVPPGAPAAGAPSK